MLMGRVSVRLLKNSYFKFQHFLADIKVTKQIITKDISVVYHLYRETVSSTVCANGKQKIPEEAPLCAYRVLRPL